MKKKILIADDGYFLARYIFRDESKRNEFDYISICKKIKKDSFFTRFYSAVFSQRLIPAVFFVFSSAKKRFLNFNKSYCAYRSALLVGIEDLENVSFFMKKYPNIDNITIWQWNPISTNYFKKIDFRVRSFLLRLVRIKIITFDANDAKKYNLSYHAQIYSMHLSNFILDKYKYATVSNSAFYIGKDKGRMEKVLFVDKCLKLCDIPTYFRVVTNSLERKEHLAFDKTDICITNSQMNYDEYLDNMLKSNIIVEIMQDGQSGITIRALEALFFNKKLITDNIDIINYDFYNKNNIFIFRYSSESILTDLRVFIELPFVDVDINIKKKYDVSSLISMLE